MKTQILTCLIAILAMLKLTSCSTECDEPTKILLKELDKYVPYTGYDTLKFLHNNTDTQTFIGQGINYFWVHEPKSEPSCPEDHQSLAIQFRNQQNGNIIKMEYVYDRNFFYNKDENTYYKFYKNGISFGPETRIYDLSPTIINGVDYSISFIFSLYQDTSEYIMFRRPYDGGFGGIVKIKQLGDTLTILR